MVKEVLVQVGQSVEKGQILVVLSSSVFDYAGRLSHQSQLQHLDTQRNLLLRQVEIQQQIQDQSRDRLLAEDEGLLVSVEIIKREAGLLGLQLGTSERNITSIAVLLENGSASQSQYDRSYTAHLDLLRQQQEIEQRRAQLRQRRQDLRAQRLGSRLLFEQQKLQSLDRLAQYDYEIDILDHQERFTVVAEDRGVVAALAIEAGQPVSPGQLLLRINPVSPQLQAIIYVPSRVLGKLATGQELMLSYDAYDYRYYGRYQAVVTQISRASLDPRELLLPVPGISEPVFKVLASLNEQTVEGPDIARLQAGMLLNADFITAEMSLAAFIFKPLLRLRGRIW
ncbi:MAG: HlyD family efflux transporter periplasmic adaptor subunit [Proteobacteria bacterium]|nr:HlyD family efflux transporter periplasmic adaptor subunit [Pseudomonadota bacterium]